MHLCPRSLIVIEDSPHMTNKTCEIRVFQVKSMLFYKQEKPEKPGETQGPTYRSQK